MISLDIDLSYLCKYFEIGTKRLNQYGNQSIEEIMNAEAAQGNCQAANFESDVLNNPAELVKLLKLMKPQNRFLILNNMNQDDLMYIMEFLEPKDLLMGLMLFNKDMLLKLMYTLPQEKLANVVLNTMQPQKFVKQVPEEFLNEFFMSDNLDKDMILESMANVQPEEFQKMMENFTGEPCYDNPDNIKKKLNCLEEDKFKQAMSCFERHAKEKMILNMVNKKPELFAEFSKDALIYPMTQLEKPELVKAMSVLEPEDILPMMEELPEQYMALVATQISPDIFAQLLSTDFKDILSEIGI